MPLATELAPNVALNANTAPANLNGVLPDPAVAPEISTVEMLTKRVNDLGRIIDRMTKQFPAKVEDAAPPKPGDKLAALEESLKRLEGARDKNQKHAVRSAIMSAMVETAGFDQSAAGKLADAMQREAEFVVDEESGEVYAASDAGRRTVKDVVAMVFQRDDWRGLIPAKSGAKPLPKNGQIAPGHTEVRADAQGVFSGTQIRTALGIK